MRLAESVATGARREPEVETRMLRAFDAGAEDLLSCRGVLIGTPENFGYMSGAIKDFFDRTYDQVREHQLNLPYALFVSAGNDGSGAVREVDRIVKGYPMRRGRRNSDRQRRARRSGPARLRDLGRDYGPSACRWGYSEAGARDGHLPASATMPVSQAMSEDAVLFERQGHVALITLNRPEALNVFSGQMGLGSGRRPIGVATPTSRSGWWW